MITINEPSISAASTNCAQNREKKPTTPKKRHAHTTRKPALKNAQFTSKGPRDLSAYPQMDIGKSKSRKLFGINPNDPFLTFEAKALIYDSLIGDLTEDQIDSLMVRWESPLAHRSPIIPQEKYSSKKIPPPRLMTPRELALAAKRRALLAELKQHTAFVATPEMNLGEMFNNVMRVPHNFSVIAENIDAITPAALQAANNLNGAVNNFNATANSAKGAIDGVFSWLDQLDSSMYIVLGAFLSVYSLQKFRLSGSTNRVLLVVGCLTGITVLGKFASDKIDISEALTYLTKLLSSTPEPTDSVQMEDVDDIIAVPEIGINLIGDSVRAIITCLTVYISTASGVNIPQNLFRNFGQMDRVTTTITESLTLFLQFFEKITNYIRETILGKTSMSFFHANSVPIDTFLDKARTILAANHLGNLPKDLKNLQTLKSLVIEGNEIMAKSIRDRYSAGILDILRREINLMETLLADFYRASVHLRGLRQEPVSVMFGGGAGTGKSVAMAYLCSAIMGRVLNDHEFEAYERLPADFVYNRQAEAIYWDGMESHIITTFDDFGQAKDVAGQPDNEYMNFIRAVNTNEFDMHAAGMEKKGNSKFHSKFVFATTNRISFNPESIFSEEALYRRITINLLVVPKPEFTTRATRKADLMHRKLDMSKIRKTNLTDEFGVESEGTVLDPAVQNFHVVRKDGTPTGVVYDFDQLVAEVERLYEERKGWHLRLTAELAKVALEYRTSRPQSGFVSKQVDTIEIADFLDPTFDEEFKTLLGEVEDVSTSKGPTVDQWKLDVRHVCVNLWGSDMLFTPYEVCLRLIYVQYYNDSARLPSLIQLGEFVEFHKYAKVEVVLPKVDLSKYLVPPKHESILSRICDAVKAVYNDHVLPSICKVADFAQNNPLVIIGVTAALTLMYRNLGVEEDTPKDHENVVAESYGTETKTKKAQTRKISSLRKAKPEIAINGKFHSDVATSLEKRNMFQLFGPNSKGEQIRHGYLTVVVGRVAIIPNHFIKVFEAQVKLNPNFADKLLTISREEKTFHKHIFPVSALLDGVRRGLLEQNDLTLVVLPVEVQPCRDIRKFFVNEKDLDTMMYNVPFDLRLPGAVSKSHVGVAQARDKHLVVSSSETGSYTVRYQYQYQNFTQSGDCGGLFTMIRPSNGTRVIAGFHVAACAALKASYAASICLEDLEEDLKLCVSEEEDVFVSPIEFEGADPTVPSTLPEMRFDYLGKLSPAPVPVTTTKITRSPLWAKWGPPKTSTAKLRVFEVDGEVINPMQVAHTKYGHNPVYINPDDIRFVCNEFLVQLGTVHPSMVRLYSYSECIHGVEGMDSFPKIPADTSAGYPMNLQGHLNLKKEISRFPKDSPEYKEVLSALTHELEAVEALYEAGTIPQWVFTDNLKDERRPIEKVKSGSTRKFSGVPYLYLILLRKYFGSFVAAMKEGRIKNSQCSGINVYSNEWTEIVQYLSAFTPSTKTVEVGAGDFSAFDGHQQISIHQGILYMINRWYTNHGQGASNHMRSRLYMGILNSLHIAEGMLFYILGNMSSGVYGTTTFNSMYNVILFRLAFQEACPNKRFSECVRVVTFGDDNVFSVCPTVADEFNELTMPGLMAQFGQVYTREDKLSAKEKFRSIDRIDFLKRGFIYDPVLDRYLAPLSLEVVLEIPYWTKKGSISDQITMDNVAAAMRELSLHPRHIFENYAGEMRSSLMFAYPEEQFPEDVMRDFETLRASVCAEQSWMF
jgi:hypothetical protein